MTYHKDKTVRIDYNINVIAAGTQSKIIGQTLDDSREFPYTESSSSIVWVDSILGSDVNDGLFSAPVKTISRAIAICNGTTKTIVCIKDSATYTERIESGGMRELWAYIGCTPTIILKDTDFNSFGIITNITNIATVSSVNIANEYSCGICRPLSNDGTLLIYNLNGSTKTYAFRRLRSDGSIESSSNILMFPDTTTWEGVTNYPAGTFTTLGRVLGGVVTDEGNIIVATMEHFDTLPGTGRYITNHFIHIFKPDFTLIGKYDLNLRAFGWAFPYTAFVNLEALSNNKFVYVSKDTYDTTYKFKVFNGSDCSDVFTWKVIEYAERVTQYDSGSFMLFFRAPADGKRFKVYSSATGALISSNNTSSGVGLPYDMKRLKNGNFVFANESTAMLFDSNLTMISSNSLGQNGVDGSFTFNSNPVNGTAIGHVSFFSNIIELKSGDYIISYGYKVGGDQRFGYSLYSGTTGAQITYKALLTGRKATASRSMCAVIPLSSDAWVYYIQSDNGSTNAVDIHVGVDNMSFKSHIFNQNIVLNNLKFSGNNSNRVSKLIDITANKTALIQNCIFTDCIGTIPSKTITAITTNGALTFLQSIIFGTGTGIKATSNNVDISYSQLYRCLNGYAVDITGAGAGIKINHCDIIRNYGGVKLTSNAGTEIIKNSIFCFNATFDVYAQTAMAFLNSVYNGSVYRGSGSSLIQANPLYVNDGAISYADVDFNLRRVVSGYPYDSPACGLADDGDAGSIDIDFSDIVETKESITIKKPKKIDKIIKPVNPTSVTLANGNVKSHNYAWSEELIFSYDEINILEEDLQKIKLLLLNPKSTVRIYLDPVSNPLSYSTFTMIYDPFKTSPELYSFSGLGGKGSQLKFIRQFEG